MMTSCEGGAQVSLLLLALRKDQDHFELFCRASQLGFQTMSKQMRTNHKQNQKKSNPPAVDPFCVILRTLVTITGEEVRRGPEDFFKNLPVPVPFGCPHLCL